MKILTNFYTLTAYENVLHVEFFSSWDERVARDYIRDLRSIGMEFYQEKPWAILSNRKNWYLYTPEAERLLAEAAVSVKTRLTHYAIVAGQHSEIKKWQTQKILNHGVAFDTRFFDDIQEAEAWLASFGYHMAPLQANNSTMAT